MFGNKADDKKEECKQKGDETAAKLDAKIKEYKTKLTEYKNKLKTDASDATKALVRKTEDALKAAEDEAAELKKKAQGK